VPRIDVLDTFHEIEETVASAPDPVELIKCIADYCSRRGFSMEDMLDHGGTRMLARVLGMTAALPGSESLRASISRALPSQAARRLYARLLAAPIKPVYVLEEDEEFIAVDVFEDDPDSPPLHAILGFELTEDPWDVVLTALVPSDRGLLAVGFAVLSTRAEEVLLSAYYEGEEEAVCVRRALAAMILPPVDDAMSTRWLGDLPSYLRYGHEWEALRGGMRAICAHLTPSQRLPARESLKAACREQFGGFVVATSWSGFYEELEEMGIDRELAPIGFDEEACASEPTVLLRLPRSHALWAAVHRLAPISEALSWAAGNDAQDVVEAWRAHLAVQRWRAMAAASEPMGEELMSAVLYVFRLGDHPIDALEMPNGAKQRLARALYQLGRWSPVTLRLVDLPAELGQLAQQRGFGETSYRQLREGLLQLLLREAAAPLGEGVDGPPAPCIRLNEGLEELAGLFPEE